MPDNPLLGLMGYAGPANDQGLLQMASEWPPRWWKRMMGIPESSNTLPVVYAATPNHSPNPQASLNRVGYLATQRSGNYNESLSRRAYATVEPLGSEYYILSPEQRLEKARDMLRGEPRKIDPNRNQASNDAFAMYLGLPQQHGSFEVSPYKPSRSNNPNQVYLRMPGFWNLFENSEYHPRDNGDAPNDYTRINSAPAGPITSYGISRLLKFLGNRDRRVIAGDRLTDSAKLMRGIALADFTVSRGRDSNGSYISYYDKWDLDAPGANTVIGRPFEIYDRIYYDPATLQPVRR